MDQEQLSGFYRSKEYNTKERFASYWHQINEITRLSPGKVLEVGVGSGLVAGCLKDMGIDVVTMDINPWLSPDVVGDVLDIPFSDGSFDVVACFEVLEHIDFDMFERAVAELSRVSRGHLVISLPDLSWYAGGSLRLPKLGELDFLISFPRLTKREMVFKQSTGHRWEIGKRGYPLRKVESLLRGCGLEIERTYRVFENPSHRFFTLRKKRMSR